MKRKLTLKETSLIGIMTAVTCIIGPLSITLPVSPIPISLTNFAVFLSAYVLGPRNGTISYLIYLLIGLLGIPVFSGFSSGLGILFGPTGGYLIGFLFLTPLCGWGIQKLVQQMPFGILGILLGMTLSYFFGSLWLSVQSHLSITASLLYGVAPFIVWDIGKLLLAFIIGKRIRKSLQTAGLL